MLAWVMVSLSLLLDDPQAIWTYGILPGAVILATVGWIDDHHPLRARLRFAVQLAVSVYLLAFAQYAGLGISGPWLVLGGLWLLWNANLYNFMDGSHGMAGMQGAFSGAVLAWLFDVSGQQGLALVGLMISASCLGFLPWNLARRRVFMGDVASVPLGFALAGLCGYGAASGAIPLSAALLVLLVFIVDASLTLLVRVLRGERWYTPHRQHLYQQLIRSGWSHESVLALYLSINMLLVLPAIVVTVRNPEFAWFVTWALIAVMTVGWALAVRRLGVTA
jgi:Fuc2NAc and GlcNAc transferase